MAGIIMVVDEREGGLIKGCVTVLTVHYCTSIVFITRRLD